MNTSLNIINDPVWKILVHSSSIQLDNYELETLSSLASIIKDWDRVIEQAEVHGLAPLLYHHLKRAATSIPIPATQKLKALSLRHKRASQIRALALAELLERLEHDQIMVVFLKGAALARFLYPDPGLRPMRDIDILTSHAQAIKVQGILRELGYLAHDHHDGYLYDHHHLPNASRIQDGMTISIEVHHDAFSGDVKHTLTTSSLHQPTQSLLVGDIPTFALGHVDMLRHLCQHSFEPAGHYKLGALADIYGYIVKYYQEIDWDSLKQDEPILVNQLRTLHLLRPLPTVVETRLQPLPNNPLAGTGQCLIPLSLIRSSNKSLTKKTLAILFPPKWWAYGFYGIDPNHSLWLNRIFSHPVTVLRWLLRRRAASRKTFSEIRVNTEIVGIDNASNDN